MNFKELLICLILLSPGLVSAQYLELGVAGGFSQYFGDLQSGYESKVNHLAFGAFGRYNLSRRLAVKAQFSQITLSGDDQNQKAFNTFEFNRNLSFKSKLYELAFTGEFNLAKFDIRDDLTTAPYLFAGVAGFYNSPKGLIDGQWYDLHALGTEGQTLEGGKKYSKLNIAFPVGAGMKISLNERISIGFELGLRFSMSDYIDDVSGVYPNLAQLEEQNSIASRLSFRSPEILPQLAGNPVGKPRGDADTKDGYFIGNFTISFNLVEGYDLEFDERLKRFSPNYKPKQKNLRRVKKELRKEEKKRAKKPGQRKEKEEVGKATQTIKGTTESSESNVEKASISSKQAIETPQNVQRLAPASQDKVVEQQQIVAEERAMDITEDWEAAAMEEDKMIVDKKVTKKQKKANRKEAAKQNKIAAKQRAAKKKEAAKWRKQVEKEKADKKKEKAKQRKATDKDKAAAKKATAKGRAARKKATAKKKKAAKKEKAAKMKALSKQKKTK